MIMKTLKYLTLASIVATSYLLMNCYGYIVAGPPVPPNEIILQAPSTLHVWIPGYYTYSGGSYIWIQGHYTIPPKGKKYVPGNWHKTPKGYKRSKGHWKGNRKN
jgi:hypothetical protein